MKRTQIYIDEETYRNLKKESSIKNTTVSELIRKSLRNRNKGNVQKILNMVDRVSGMWCSRAIDPEKYVRELRKNRKIW